MGGNDLGFTPNIASAEDCQKLCQSNNACKYFTYDGRDKNCYVKHSASIPTTTPGVVSGPRVCQNCFQDQIDFYANNIGSIPNITGAEACQKICQGNVACRFFTYDTRDKTCFSKYAAAIPTVVLGVVSGPKSCTTCFLPQLDVESSNDLVKSNNVKNTEDCQKLCQSNNDCRFFTFNSSTGTCVLKQAAINPVTSTASTLGPKYC